MMLCVRHTLHWFGWLPRVERCWWLLPTRGRVHGLRIGWRWSYVLVGWGDVVFP